MMRYDRFFFKNPQPVDFEIVPNAIVFAEIFRKQCQIGLIQFFQIRYVWNIEHFQLMVTIRSESI